MRAVIVTLLLLSAPAVAGDWVGSAACGACHATEYAAWQQTAHARAADHLGAQPRARCLGCHGTGDAPAGKTAALEVGCEACHGAGGDYATDDLMRDPALARALGLRDVSARDTVCTSCHRTTGTRLAPPDMKGKVH